MSLIPAALDGLVALAKRAAVSYTPPSPWQVSDGAPRGTTKEGVVCIGFTGSAGEIAVEEIVDSSASASPRRALKTYDVVSQISRYAGNGTIGTQRKAVFDMVDAIEAELLADPTLGGAIQGRAWWAGCRYASIASGGPNVTVEFTVRVQGFEA